jgi:hypothetical protein
MKSGMAELEKLRMMMHGEEKQRMCSIKPLLNRTEMCFLAYQCGLVFETE